MQSAGARAAEVAEEDARQARDVQLASEQRAVESETQASKATHADPNLGGKLVYFMRDHILQGVLLLYLGRSARSFGWQGRE